MIATILIAVFGLVLYFLPTIIGWKTRNAAGIFILNLFLWFTVIGWIGAMIWAVSAKPQ